MASKTVMMAKHETFFTDCKLQPSKEHLADNQYHFHDDFYIAKRGNNIKRNKNSLIEFFESFGEKNWCSEKQKLGITDKTFTDKQT